MKPIRDMKLAVTLLALGHEVRDFNIEGRTVYFHFDPDQIAADEEAFYMRQLSMVATEQMLAALQRFRLLLARKQGDMLLLSSREAVVALMAAGYQAEGLTQLEKMLYFEFMDSPDIRQFLVGLVNGSGNFINVDDFWREYQYFSDALRSR